MKTLPSKVAYLCLAALTFFFSAALTAPNSPELKIHNRNVAQDTSVYYSVGETCIMLKFPLPPTYLVLSTQFVNAPKGPDNDK